MVLQKFEGESEYAFHKRLVYGKLVDKTLSDIDYSELSEAVYGQAYAPDVARRMMYGSCRTLQLLDKERTAGISDREVLNELDAKKLELQKERQRYFDQRREYNKLVSESGRSEHLEDRLAAAASNLDSLAFKYTPTEPAEPAGDAEAILVLCDWHYGMVTHNAWNTYDTDICVARVLHTISQAKARLRLHHVKKLHVLILGDIIQGAIHTSSRVASNELVCDQLMQASELIANAIADLSSVVETVEVHSTYGNHSRTVQNKNDSIHRDNMERIIPWWLKHRLGNIHNVEILDESDTEFIYLNACGRGICASHGDLDGVKSSPRLLSTLFSKRYGVSLECVLLADKHHCESFEELGVLSIISDALCGSDDYANSKRLYSTPGQTMLIVTPDAGVDAIYHLKCN